jgi:nucleotide-binding universal stress UspA family protein
MSEVATLGIAFLALGELDTDPRIARRLPAEMARRLHALPIAEDGGRITVAMADPADESARHALLAALGTTTCVVQADQAAIDSRLSQIWPSAPQVGPVLAVCNAAQTAGTELWAYAQALADALGGVARQAPTPGLPPSTATDDARPLGDVALFDGGQHPWLRLALSALSDKAGDAPRALLVAEQPRWPVRRILVVLWGDGGDEGAIDWAERIAQPGHSSVTVLVVVPPVPAMYHGCARMEQGLPALLRSATPLGRQARHAARRLVQAGVDCVLRLRQGAPEWEVAREVTAGDYDLVIVTASPSPLWQRWLEDDLVGTLLRCLGRPLLIARPAAG